MARCTYILWKSYGIALRAAVQSLLIDIVAWAHWEVFYWYQHTQQNILQTLCTGLMIIYYTFLRLFFFKRQLLYKQLAAGMYHYQRSPTLPMSVPTSQPAMKTNGQWLSLLLLKVKQSCHATSFCTALTVVTNASDCHATQPVKLNCDFLTVTQRNTWLEELQVTLFWGDHSCC